MKYKCSWCGYAWQNKLKLPGNLPKGSISHGICRICAEKLDKDIDKKLGQVNEILKRKYE